MAKSARHLSLVVPGLLGPVDLMDPAQLPSLPSLSLLLRRSKKSLSTDKTLEALLFSLFQVCGYDEHLPVAPLTYRVDAEAGFSGWCMRADPVYMVAGQNSLRVMASGAAMQLTEAEAEAIGRSLNQHFAPQGVRFETPDAHRWYCFSEQHQQLLTTSLRQVQGRPVQALLPAGEDGVFWNGILAEAQMLLHQHEVNQVRAQKGLPQMNSLWLWGQGEVPSVASNNWEQVWANEPLAVSLAHATSVASASPPETASDWLAQAEEGNHLLILEHLIPALPDLSQDMWSHFSEAVELLWLQPLLRALQQKQLGSLSLYPEDGHVYQLTRTGVRRFWQRPLSLLCQLQQSDYE